MSDVMEKTFSSVSGFIMSNLGSRNMDVSPGFHNLIRSIRKARSKTEEEKVIQKELELLKLKLQQPDTSVTKVKEYLVRILYCELLGYAASFSYIHAIKLAQQGSLSTKRVGYLSLSLFLHENHELILLLVNTLQRDLTSSNMLHNCMALSAVCKLIGSEMVPAVLPLVEEKLKHPKALVRKKAVMALRALYSRAPHMLQSPDELFKWALCDRDAVVTSTALYIHSDLIKENPAAHKRLVRPLVAIHRQICDRKLSSDFEYHGVSAPWMQIQILRMLARLGAEDEHYSSLMYDLLDDVVQQTSTLSHNIAYAVQYECLITIASIYPHEQLLSKAAQCISKFLKSFNYNLKYMGICALSAVLKVFPSCAEEHQLTVIDCLDDADDTIRLKTLDLLFRMTTGSNVQVICDRLLTYLKGTRDTFIRRDLLSKIIQLADNYQPTVQWYLNTMTQVLLICGGLVPRAVINSIISVMSKDSQSGGDISRYALQLYLPLVSERTSSSELLQVGCWVLGEFAHLASAPPATEIVGILCSLLDRRLDDDMKIRVMGALTKVVCSCGVVSQDVTRAIELCQRGSSMELRQRACELHQLCSSMDLMKEMLPRPDFTEGLQFDWTLSFLDEFVSDALAHGAAPYKPKQQRHAERQQRTQEIKPLFSGLNFVPYQSPTPSMVSGVTTSTSTPEGRITAKSVSSDPSLSSGASANSAEPKVADSSTGLKLEGVKRVWGQQGYAKATPTTRAHAQPPAIDSQMPLSHSVTPSSPGRGAVPSVQLSSATAVGRTMSSHRASSGEAVSEEDSKKKELAKALFGGLHKTMTTSSKKPMERKPHPQPDNESSPKSPAVLPQLTDEGVNRNMPSASADLLLLSELESPLSGRSPVGADSRGKQYEERGLGGKKPDEKEDNQDFYDHLRLREDGSMRDMSRTEQNNPSRTHGVTSQEASIMDEVISLSGEDEQTSVVGHEELLLTGPKSTITGRQTEELSYQQKSMYEDFKGVNLSEEYLDGHKQLSETNSSNLRDETANQSLLHENDVPRLSDSEPKADRILADTETNHLLNFQDSSTLSGISEQKVDTNIPDSALTVLSDNKFDSSSIGTRMSEPQSELTSSLAKPAKEISILDSSPEGTSLHGQPTLPQNLLPEGWRNFPRSSEQVELCHDTLLVIILYKVWMPASLGLVFHVTNLSPKDMVTELELKLNVSSNLKVSNHQEHNSLSAATLEPSTTKVLTAELSCVAPAPSMSLGGELAYKDHTKTSRRLFFNSPILVSDLLRPLEIQTSEFGKQWPKQTRDSKFTTQVDTAVSMSKVMTLLTKELNLHLVEIIGSEGIACGTLLSGPVCLLHVKLPGSRSLELWVRSSSQLMSESIAKQCREDIFKKL